MLNTHNLPCLLVELVEHCPWSCWEAGMDHAPWYLGHRGAVLGPASTEGSAVGALAELSPLYPPLQLLSAPCLKLFSSRAAAAQLGWGPASASKS